MWLANEESFQNNRICLAVKELQNIRKFANLHWLKYIIFHLYKVCKDKFCIYSLLQCKKVQNFNIGKIYVGKN